MEQLNSLIPGVRRFVKRLEARDVSVLLAQIQKLQALSSSALHPSAAACRPASDVRQIGIWEADPKSEGEFVRMSSQFEEWRYWADVERIRKKGAGKRIVWLGESVARGYFFDPIGTPAGFVERSLRDSFEGGCEVIDLARTDIRPFQLCDLADQSVALKPDLMVVFAGNNWHFGDGFALPEYEALADVISKGFAAASEFFRQTHLPALTRAVLRRLANAASVCKAPLLLVVPEFNLRDQRPESQRICPILPGGANATWENLRLQVEHSLERGKWRKAETLAAKMISLDNCISPESHRLLGLAREGLQDRVGSRNAFEAARDCVCGLPVGSSPRCCASVQRTMRECAQGLGITVVDLPRVFAEQDLQRPPGHQWFMDYCHHTLEGLRVAGEAISKSIARTMRAANAPSPISVEMETESEGAAYFLAALHNAQFGQSKETLERLCRRALSLSPKVAAYMTAYLDFRTRPLADWMSDSFEQMCLEPNLRRYLFKNSPSDPNRSVSLELISAITNSLDAVDRKRAIKAIKDNLDSDDPIDLLRSAVMARTTWEAQPEESPAYYMARRPYSEFVFFSKGAREIRLGLTCRVRGRPRNSITLQVNGASFQKLACRAMWRSVEIAIPRNMVRSGLNVVKIGWPALPDCYEEALEKSRTSVEKCKTPEIYPVFGEIHRFVAVRRIARQPGVRSPRREIKREPKSTR